MRTECCRSVGFGLAIAMAALGSLAPRVVAQAPPQAQRLIEIDAVALDRGGNPVTDLRPQDLEVWIGGYRVPIESLDVITPAGDSGGRLIVLLLDDVTLEPALLARAREVARRFVGRILPGDRMAVVSLNGSGMELTDDPTRLRRQVDALRQSLGVMPIDTLGAHLLRAVSGIARSVSEAPGERKTIVAIGSGWLLDTPVPLPQLARDVRQEWNEALRALDLADATYYVIDPQGVGSSRQPGADGLARETGGHAFLNTNDLDGAVDRILREAGHYYVIRVGDPPVGRSSPLRELDVRGKRSGVTVRAPRVIRGS